MPDAIIHLTAEQRQMAAVSRLEVFEAAVVAYSAARTELVGLGAIVAMQVEPPTEAQRARLREVGTQHFQAGEEVKALAMTLMSAGLLTRCATLVRTNGEGLH